MSRGRAQTAGSPSLDAEGDEFEIVVGGCALKVGEMVRQRHGESYAWHLRTS